ncbi:hypothetical protein Bbelb_253540 [Branchiostoma belcheri]|nr:hypothetical protein Bbelb_253540 [Branchiostoma belcheri]
MDQAGSAHQPGANPPARGVPAWDPPGLPLDPARDPVAARPECKSRSAPYRVPHGSTLETDWAPDGSLTETCRQRSRKGTFNPDPEQPAHARLHDAGRRLHREHAEQAPF